MAPHTVTFRALALRATSSFTSLSILHFTSMRNADYTIGYCCNGGCGGVVGFFFPKIPYPISPPSIENIG